MDARRFVAGVVLIALGAVVGSCGRSDDASAVAEPPRSRAPNSVVQEDWPIFRGQAALTGLAGGEIPDDLALLWTSGTEVTPSSPVIVGGRVYVGTSEGEVRAIRLADGEVAWRTRLEKESAAPPVGEIPRIVAPIEAAPLVVGGRVYVGNADGTLWCLDAEGGAVLWSYQTGDVIVSSANAVGEGEDRRILVGSHDCRLHGLDVDGKLLWSYETEGFVNGTAAIAGDKAIFGGCDGRLHVVSWKDGAVLGSHEVGTYVAASAAAAGGRAFLGHFEGRTLCMDIASGERVWEYGEGDLPFFSSPAVDGQRVVIGGRDKKVHAIDRETGAGLWTFRTRGRVEGSPVICGSKVVAGSEDGRLYILDIETGERLWSYEIGSRIHTTPAVAAGFIVVGSLGGGLHAFGPR